MVTQFFGIFAHSKKMTSRSGLIINRYITISPDGDYAALVRGDRFLEIYLVNLNNQEITKAYHFGEKQFKEPYSDRLGGVFAWQNKYDISGSFFDENNNFILIDHINGLFQVYNPSSKINPVNGSKIDNELLRTKKRAAIKTEITERNHSLGIIAQKNYTIQFDVNESESKPFIQAHFTDYETGNIFYSERLTLESRTGQYPNFDAVNVLYNPYDMGIYVWHNETEHYPEMVYYNYKKVLDLTFPSTIKWMEENEIYDLYKKRKRLNTNAVTSQIKFFYEGDMKNGFAHGIGSAVSENGEIVIKNGRFEDGKLLEGTAFWVDRRYIFAGEFGDNIVKKVNFDDETTYYYPVLNGIGMIIYPKGNASKGEFTNSMLNGNGEVNYVNGYIHRGMFKENKLHGAGERLSADGDKLLATFNEGKPDGRATLITSEGLENNVTFNSSGERTDREYLNNVENHKIKQEELVRKFQEVYEVEYQAIKDKKAKVDNLINSIAFGAAMGGMASAMGADDLTAIDFGVTAMNDSYNQTTSGLRNFNPSLSSMSNMTNGPDGLLSDYKRLEVYTNSLNKAGATVSDALGWGETQENSIADALAGLSEERRQLLEDMYQISDTDEKMDSEATDQGFKMPDCESREPLPIGWKCMEKNGKKAPVRIDVPELIGKWYCTWDAEKYGYITYSSNGTGEIKYCSGYGCSKGDGYSVKQFNWGVVPDEDGNLSTFENLIIIQNGAPTQHIIAQFEKSENRIISGPTAYKK